MRKFLRYFVYPFGLTALSVGVLLLIIQYASRQQPEFYRQAMNQEPNAQAKIGDQLERQVLTLHNESRREGAWHAAFADEQINSWLASDLEEKFPGALPPQFQDPRVNIQETCLRLACRYEDHPIKSVLSIEVDVHLTEEPNVVALQIRKARAGMLPVPLGDVLNTVSAVASRAEIDLNWKQFSGDPVALVTIPVHRQELKQLLHLDRLELRDGEILLSGRTEIDETSVAEEADEEDAQPLVGQAEQAKNSRQ